MGVNPSQAMTVRLLDFHGYKEGSQRRAFFISNQITNN
jgi:hypothetical protein